MECVNFHGQGRPVSQIHWLQHGWLSPSYQIWNALNSFPRVGLLAKYHWLQPVCLSPSYKLECFNLLRTVSKILLSGRVAVSFQSNMDASTFLAKVGRLAKCDWLQPDALSPCYQIWNALTFLAKVGRLAKYKWL
ncbi:hypothetical protein CEXT_226171 [Caerostris extrusa]|uniref:Uncharacterized protein n=1 Tax=Caerostris extrusa TaxID=172846 RepID=A0AAV4XY29_CAEEX|nr:hypothetical protein CEXT_226171 [Caerostris extrusa]